MNIFYKPPHNLPIFSPTVLIATFLGSGLFRFAPGTLGSFFALIIGYIILINYNPIILFVSCILFYIIGLWACHSWISQISDIKEDPSQIVIDEVVGMWVTLLFIPSIDELFYILCAFILFRFFDIFKPWIIGMIDKNIKGAWGIMLDDIVAGLMSGLVLYGFNLFIQFFS